MTHFGVLSLPLTGHLNPILSLASELKERGHPITVFGILDIEEKVKKTGVFDFVQVGEKKYPKGELERFFQKQGELTGFKGLRSIFNFCGEQSLIHLEAVTTVIKTAIKEKKIDVLIIDQSLLEGESLASFLELPFITICACPILYPEPQIPPMFTSWNFSDSRLASLRNKIASTFYTLLGLNLIREIREFRKKHNLTLSFDNNPGLLWSRTAVICQQPREFEFPRRNTPNFYYFTGPLVSQKIRPSTNFPWERLEGRLLVYASLGTLQNKSVSLYQIIADACKDLEVQLVISLGGSALPESLPKLAGNPIIVEYTPQLELLKKAALCITHAGMNTTMESLMNGVPMIAIPITSDQPGVAARIKWTGIGEFISLKKLNVKRLRIAIEKVLKEPSYKKNAIRLQKAIQESGGVKRAADIIEKKISNM